MIVNGTSYHDGTPKAVIRILEHSRESGLRIRLHYGQTSRSANQTRQIGTDWLEEHDVEGRIGRSTGSEKIPLMIASSRSTGGPPVLDHCIVRIREAKGGGELWRHPKYRIGTAAVRMGRGKFKIEVLVDGLVHARFRTEEQASRWIKKMGF